MGGCGAARGHGRRGTPWVSRANFVTEPERCCNARVMTHKSRGGVREIDYKCCASRSLTVAFDLTCDHGMARNYPSGGVASCSSSFREFRQRWRRRRRLLRLRLRLRRHQTRARRLRVSSWALPEQERGFPAMASIDGQQGSCQQHRSAEERTGDASSRKDTSLRLRLNWNTWGSHAHVVQWQATILRQHSRRGPSVPSTSSPPNTASRRQVLASHAISVAVPAGERARRPVHPGHGQDLG